MTIDEALLLFRLMPKRAERAVRLALLDCARHARAEGLKRTREAYLGKKPRRAKGFVRGTGMRKEVSFVGGVGMPLSRFPTDPPRPRKNARRRASGYVSARVKRGGAMRAVLSPTGERAFWVLSKSGSPRLVWRRKGERKLHGGLMAASPIQALQKRGAMEDLRDEAAAYLERRVRVNLDRVLAGEL